MQSWIQNLADVGAVVKSKRASYLVEGNQLAELPHVHEDVSTGVLQIAVDERLLLIEATGNDVLCILQPKLVRLLEGELLLEQGLLIVRQHDDQRYIEDILQPSCELERDRVTEVEGAARGTTTGVQEEGFAVLVLVQDEIEVTVREEEASP